MDKLRFILLFAVMLVAGGAAAYDFESGGIYYNIIDKDAKTVEVTNREGSVRKKIEGYNGKLTIPSVIVVNSVEYQVKQIGVYAFFESDIDSLVIEEGVESIREWSFYNCANLKEISFSSTIKNIGDDAFANCNKVIIDKFPSSLLSIGDNAFINCSEITEAVFPEGCVSIGEKSFAFCIRLRKIILPSTLNSIGKGCFRYRNSVSNLEVISHLINPFEIGDDIFSEGDNLGKNNAPHATLYVPIGTLKKYQILEGWNVFGNVYEGEPFEGESSGLTYTCIVGSNIAIVKKADYSSLQEVSIPAYITVDKDEYKVKGVGESAFASTPLRSVRIEEGIEDVGKGAFLNCYSLVSVSFPKSLMTIGDKAFMNCRSLDSAMITGNVVSIGSDAFNGCQIKELKIPEATIYIGDGAFSNCGSLLSIFVDEKNKYYNSRNNCNSLIETETNRLLRGTPSSQIPNDVVEICDYAFSGLSGLAELSIPNSVTKIGSWAFQNCYRLSSLYVPAGVKSIGSGLFSGCKNLNSIIVDPNNTEYDSRYNCNAIIEKSSAKLIAGCNFTTVPRGVRIIGESSLSGCYGRDSLILPSGITTIEWGTLRSNDNLKYVELPSSIISLANGNFDGCKELTKIVSNIKDPTKVTISDLAFAWGFGYNGDIRNFVDIATLYVPKGKKSLYQQVSPWNKFTIIEEMDGDPLSTPLLSYDGRYVTATSVDEGAELYYSTDDSAPSEYYDGPIAIHDLGIVRVIAGKSFRADSEEATITIEYLYDGDTLKLARAGMMADAIKWCSTDSIEKMTVVGPINSSEFETIRGLGGLKFLNLADAKIDGLAIPDNAFANTNLVSFVAPTELNSVGSGIFSGCQQLAAVSWTTNKALPDDALSDVNNPNLLLYLNSSGTAPSSVRNVIKGGVAEKITLSDDTGNNNFYCPVAFTAKSISYTRNFQQKTEVGVSRGWETITLPFDVQFIQHETNGELIPFSKYTGNNSQRPFWLYTLENNKVSAATEIKANVPYLICMPNYEAYGDEYIQAGNVTFSASNADIGVSVPQEKKRNKVSFVPAYQRVAASESIYALNVNQEYDEYPAGSLFVNNFREVRPFEAYSVHPSQAKAAGARMITVSSLIGGDDDTTGIIDMMLKKNDGTSDADAVIKVYSLSGALVKQGRAEEVTKNLPKGIYIANGKKFVVK